MFKLRTSALTLALLLLAGLVGAAQADDQAAPAFTAPWQTPEQAAQYIVVLVHGQKFPQLFNAVTGEVVRKQFNGRPGKHAYLVQGRPGVFLSLSSDDSDPLADLRLAHNGGMIGRFGKSSASLVNLNATGSAGYIRPHFPDDKTVARQVAKNIADTCRYSDDLRRVVWIKDGDIWRGDIDWNTGEIVHQKQVTHVGQFTFDSIDGHRRPIFWSGNNLFVEGRFNPAKPLVRIDLVTGALTELDWLMYEGKSIAGDVVFDPAERVALHAVDGQLRLIDLTSGKVFKVNMRFGDTPTGSQLQKMAAMHLEALPWLNDSVVVTLKGLLNVADGSIDPYEDIAAMMSQKDGKKSAQKLLMQIGRQFGRMHAMILRGDPPAVPMGLGQTKDTAGYHVTWGLADLNTGKVAEAIVTRQSGMAWIGPYRCLYAVTGKGLTGNGTFLYDRRTGKSVRLASYTDIRNPIAVAGGSTIVFTRAHDVYRVGADGTGLKKLADNAGIEATFMPRAVSLAGGDPWNLQPVKQLAVFTTGEVGDISPRDRVKQAVAGKPAELQAFALKTMNYMNENYTMHNFFDVVKATLAAVKEREQQKTKRPFANTLAEADYKDAFDPVKAGAWFRQQAVALYRHDKVQPTDAQLDDLAQRAAAQMAEAGAPTQMKPINRILREAVKSLTATLNGQKPANKQASAKPKQHANADHSGKKSSSSKQDDADDPSHAVDEGMDKADEAIDKAEDVKKKIKDLGDLFSW